MEPFKSEQFVNENSWRIRRQKRRRNICSADAHLAHGSRQGVTKVRDYSDIIPLGQGLSQGIRVVRDTRTETETREGALVDPTPSH